MILMTKILTFNWIKYHQQTSKTILKIFVCLIPKRMITCSNCNKLQIQLIAQIFNKKIKRVLLMNNKKIIKKFFK